MAKILLIFLFCFHAYAQLAPDLKELMDEVFLEDGSFSPEKINQLRTLIQTRKIEITEAIRNYEFLYKKNDYEEVVEEISEEDTLLAFNIILTYLNRLESKISFDQKLELAEKIFELEFASKVEGYEILSNTPFSLFREVLRSHEINKKSAIKGEATNLVNPETGKVFTQSELERLKGEGIDISKFNPKSNSRFWYPHDISKANVYDKFFGDTPLYEGVKIKFPTKNRGKYRKVKKSQTKPKVHFTYEHKGHKQKFKLKFGAELASEITAGALAATLGFHHDMSKYAEDFELVLPKGMTYLDFKREWLEYYKKYDPEDYIKRVSEENGQIIIVFREGLIEAKPEEILRIGPWAWGSNGHQYAREIRGMHIFNMWIANNDIKESGNNKLVLKRKGDDYEMYQFVHDLGFSFGRFSHERPGDFPWTLVNSYNENYVNFKYFSFQENSGFNHLSYSDGKWASRLIGQLSREQIRDAVEIGGWPEEVQLLYVEKLIARRNQLVEAFDLEDEVGLLEVNRNITTENGVLKNGQLTQGDFETHSQNFGSEIQSVLAPIYDNMSYIATQALIQTTSALDTMVLDSRELGFDSEILGEVQLTLDRDIRRNEIIRGNDDNYIVQDTLRVRFGLGVGVVARGKVNYYKEYKLLYPAKSLREATFHNKFILNAMIPLSIRKQQLPETYVLLMEDGIEGEGEILLGQQTLPVSLGLSKSLGRLTRTIVSKKLDSYTVYQDLDLYSGYYARLYAELLFLRIPVWQYANQIGKIGRTRYDVSLESDDDLYKLFALEEMLITGNIEHVEKVAKTSTIQSNYLLTRSDFDIFFVEKEYRRRQDDMQEVVYETSGVRESEGDYYQLDVERHDQWRFFGNGETKDRRYRLFGKVDEQGNMEDVLLDMKLFIKDNNATSEEFEKAYLKTFDQLSMQKDFFNFTPSLHSINNVWHSLEAQINLAYDQTALDKLIDTPDEVYYELMAKHSNRDAEFWATKVDNRVIDKNSRFIRNKFYHWINALSAARAARTDKQRYSIITDAFSNVVWLLSDGYQGILLGRIHAVLGKDNFFMEGLIQQSETVENTMPADTPLYNVINPGIRKKHDMFEFDYRNLGEIWELFQK